MSVARWRLVTVAAVAVGAFAAPAYAANISVSLSSSNGEGTADASLPCSSGSDGPSWRYAYSGISSTSGPLAGTWNGTVEIHSTDLAQGGAFVPAGTGRLQIQAGVGAANFEFSGGNCLKPTLAFGIGPGGDPMAAGSLPLIATGGLGSLRGMTGSGSVNTAFELGPGADNRALISLSGTFAALKPVLSVGTPHPFWGSTIRYLGHNLSVSIPVGNAGPATSVGDAFAVTISSATLAGVGNASSGIPASLGEIQSGNGSGATVIFHGATPGRKYNLTVTVTSRDALGDPDATVTSTSTITTPLTP